MKRGDLFLVRHPSGDTKKARAFVVVSRNVLVDSRFSTVICAPVYTTRDGLTTQVDVGMAEGLKHASSIHCDALVSLPKSVLTDYLGRVTGETLTQLTEACRIALAVECE